MTPAVSVVIPVFNRREFVAATVRSVLEQSFAGLEVIVVDDGSTDGSADLLAREFEGRIRLERLPVNHGRSTARNVGWALARAELVAFLDSDDLWLPEKLERQLPGFARGEVVMSHCWVGKIGPRGEPLERESEQLRREFERAAVRGYDYGGITETWCRLYTSAVVLRRELLRKTGGFDTRRSNFEDWDLLWKVAKLGEVVTVPECLVLHRTHEGNTPTVWEEDAVQWLAIMRKHLAELSDCPGGCYRMARRNLLVNMSLGEYWNRDLRASRRWMRRALLADPSLLKNPGYYVWGAPLLHACLPRPLAAWMVQKLGVDEYRS